MGSEVEVGGKDSGERIRRPALQGPPARATGIRQHLRGLDAPARRSRRTTSGGRPNRPHPRNRPRRRLRHPHSRKGFLRGAQPSVPRQQGAPQGRRVSQPAALGGGCCVFAFRHPPRKSASSATPTTSSPTCACHHASECSNIAWKSSTSNGRADTIRLLGNATTKSPRGKLRPAISSSSCFAA